MAQIAPASPGGDGEGPGVPLDRRAVLQTAGIAAVAAVAWTAPSILSVDAASAATAAPPAGVAATFVAVGQSPFVFRSTDGGETWPFVNATPNFALAGVATDGKGTWVATVGGTVAPYVLRSTDDGATWGPPTVGPKSARGAIAVLVTSAGTTWIALRTAGQIANAVATSTDGGDNWTMAAGVSTIIRRLAVGPTLTVIPARTWIGVAGSSVYRSNDDFATFTTTVLVSDTVTRSLQGVTTDGLGNWVVVNGGSNGADLLRVWRSGDDGLSWALATVQPAGVLTDVTTDGLGTWIAVGSTPVSMGGACDSWRSTDNGVTWTANSTNGIAYSAVATDRSGRWVATDGVLNSYSPWRSDDTGTTWVTDGYSFDTKAVAMAAGPRRP